MIRIPLRRNTVRNRSGTPPADIQRAIALGMAKVNVATELTAALRKGLSAELGAARKRWLPQALAEATKLLAPVVEKWIRLTGAAGRA